MTVRIGCSPTTWGVDFADHPANPPWSRVLDDIASVGCRWIELGPVGFLPTGRDELAAELDARGLRVAGTFLFQPIWDAAAFADVRATARDTCRLIAEQGGRHLVVVDRVNPVRDATAGRSAAAVRLAGRAWREYLHRIEAIAETAAGAGVRAVLHPHCGTYLEFDDEIAAALAELPAELVGLCVDTGHLRLAGADPVRTLTDWSGRVEHVHLKDVDPVVAGRVRAEGLSFWQAVDAAVFCPIGRGMVDFPAFAAALDAVRYDGVAIIEQDRNPRSGSDPRVDVAASLEYLATLGLAPAAPDEDDHA
ncbi:TIM barrel protein [Dactylosporangium sucinum]|uniref:Sugar phosphate isomerase/epimerase IoIE n=1 Tax=Dactylosporangium sucinum TaxID=1424081 RepID=A0A917TTA3_9ACTN|nr:TIM barrel protein [Dactylosporangium sucinum]GGM36312.1 sugar phosphate isomerase/epimerase IoIE [Dactylosporangium sucinum]